MKRRMLSLILTMCMVVTLLPQLALTARAAEYEWQNLGSAGFSESSTNTSTSLYVYDGTPYVAYTDSDKATVMKYTGTGDTGWEAVGSAGFSNNNAAYTSLYVYDGTPYVAYTDSHNLSKATVMKYTGAGETGWETVGSAGFSNNNAAYTSLYVYDGTPYVAYIDPINNFKATVMKYTGAGETGWEAVGSADFSASHVSYISFYVYDGTPYVAYSNSNKATVMKYTGVGDTGWEAVGSAGFSEGNAVSASLYVYDGTPYVAYTDEVNSNKATVMKYTGVGDTGWEAVGSAGFSEAIAARPSLYVHDGTPYVAYIDEANSFKATVMKYTGAGDTGWEAVGSAGFSEDGPENPSLYVYDGTPYVAYRAYSNFSKMTVMYYGEIPATASISPELSLTEENLDTNSLMVTLSGTTFADSTLDASNFTLNNAPTGVSVESVSYTDTRHCTVNLAYNGTDFSTNVPDFSLTIAAAELVSGSNLTSGTLTITATAVANTVWDGTMPAADAAAAFSGGTGIDTDPYLIRSAADLAQLSANVADGTTYSGTYFEMTADIVLNENASEYESWAASAPANTWTPIGGDNYQFYGNFDGDGHTVSGIFINTSEFYQGLFGCIYIGTVQNIGVVNSYIIGNCYVGGVAGFSSTGTVSNCYNTGSVGGSGNCVGGIVGYVVAMLSNCYNTGCVTGNRFVGGVAGCSSTGTVSNCYNTGSVSGSSDYVGGAVGSNDGATVSNCYNTGSVSGSSDYVGGVVGRNGGATVSNCYYDKQMCTAGGIRNADVTGSAEGKLTSQMVGNLFSDTTNWMTDPGLYPRICGMDSTDAAYLSAAPVTLASTSDTDYETAAAVSSDFTVSTDNGVVWTSSDSSVTISGSNATITGIVSDVILTATLGDVSKKVTITYPSSDAGLTSVLSQTDTVTTGTGSNAVPIAWEVSVANSVSALSVSDVACAAGATLNLYSDSFSTEITGTDTLALTAGSVTTAYIKVTAQDTTTILYYTVTISRASASSPGSSSPSYDYDDDSGSDSSAGSDVYVNGEKHTAGESETTTENGQSKTTVTVDTEILEDILESEDSGATVTIPVTGADIATGVLTGQMVKNMEEKQATLVVETDGATYTLPASEIDIDEIAVQFGENIDLSDIEVKVTISELDSGTVTVVENAAEEGGFTLVVQAVEFTVECTYNGEIVEITSYNAYVERTIEIPEGVNPSLITTAVVVEDDGTVRHVPTQIIEVDGGYYAVINSMTNSVYSLIYNPLEFEDVEGHWAQDAVNDMASRMVVTGDENGHYNLNNDITRAEFAAIIVRALGLVEGMGDNSFRDVATAEWYCGYIETALDYGIIAGYGDGIFGPKDNITCEQAMTMIARAMAITGLEFTLKDGEIEMLLAGYSDAADASAYARESIAACLKTEVVTASEGYTLLSKEYTTRAEVAVVIQRLLQKSALI